MTLFDSLESKPEPVAAPLPVAPPPAVSDHAARERIRGALDTTLVVEAAAGTGKTTELVRRIIAILEGGRAELDRIVAVTFTEAAAGELKLRLRAAIEKARLDPARPAEARRLLTEALRKLEEASIGTIHSLCSDLLHERPVEAAVDPLFDIAGEEASRPLFERAFGHWFETQLADPGPGVRRILRRQKREPMLGPRRRDEGPRALLRHAARQLVQDRDFRAPWRRNTGFDRDPRIDQLVADMEDLAEWASRGDPDDWFTKSLIEIRRFVDEVRRAERVHPRDYDALEAWLGEISIGKRGKHWGWRGSRFTKEFPRELRDRRDALFGRLQAFVSDAGADLAPLLRDELWPVVEAYEAAKTRIGCLDFDDLLIRARDLVRDNPAVRLELQRRFTHFFVDEFQDTDPLQVEILMLLAADDPSVTEWRKTHTVPGKLFLVGDPKQSIYSFRRADVALYREVQGLLIDQGAELIHLTVSFRSVPELQELVNAAFAPRIGSTYVPLAPFRASHSSQPAVVALPVPAPYGDYGKIVEWKIEQSLPDVIAAWIDWVVNKSGWTVTERERPDDPIPIEPRHFCLLFRRFNSFTGDVTRRYVSALEARRLPHLLVGGSSFHEREEVEAMRNALAAIERPDDELAVFATLRGPLLAISDAALLAWRDRVGGLHPFRPAPDDLPAALSEVRDAFELLRDLHRGRNRRPVADTMARLLEATRAHGALAIWPTGVQALANVSRLMDMARRAEQHGLVSFRAFVDRLEDEAERGDADEAPLLEEGVEGVRIMTVHKAKGLEFPIVVLADMTANETPRDPMRWTDAAQRLCVQRLAGCAPPELLEHAAEEMEREREEAARVLYVSATRARDILVVPVIGDERRDGWIAALNSVVYPDPLRARSPETREPPGCPSFGDDSVPRRPRDVTRPFTSVMPGLHVAEANGHRVVWWDPASLELGARASIGLSQTRILEADSEGRSSAALEAWERWRAGRASTRERGSVPTRVVLAATEWAHAVPVSGAPPVAPMVDTAAIEVIETKRAAKRPFGPRFGVLVHAVIAAVALDEKPEGVAAHAAVQARVLGALDVERDAAAAAVSAALAHPVLMRAAQAAARGECRREVSLVVRTEGGELIDGYVDLAFVEDGAWVVVDFKTDAELSARLESYRRQVALYVSGVRETSGMTARGYLLRV